MADASTLRAQVIATVKHPLTKRLGRWLILLLIVFFVGRALWSSWGQITTHHWEIAWGWLLLGFVLLIMQEISYGVIWRAVLQRLHQHIPLRESIRIYLTAEFVRYIPGNVWHVLARIQMAERQGIERTIGFASMTIELATKIAASVFVFLCSLIAWHELGSLNHALPVQPWQLAIIGVPLLVIGLQPPLLRWGLGVLGTITKRPPPALPLTGGDILVIVAAWSVSWLIGGTGFWLAVAGTVAIPLTPASWLVATGIYALGWTIGFLSFITPSGLFFREGAIALLLAAAGLIPSVTLGSLVALIAGRMLPTFAEILCVGWAYVVRRETVPLSSPTLASEDEHSSAHRPRVTPV